MTAHLQTADRRPAHNRPLTCNTRPTDRTDHTAVCGTHRTCRTHRTHRAHGIHTEHVTQSMTQSMRDDIPFNLIILVQHNKTTRPFREVCTNWVVWGQDCPACSCYLNDLEECGRRLLRARAARYEGWPKEAEDAGLRGSGEGWASPGLRGL